MNRNALTHKENGIALSTAVGEPLVFSKTMAASMFALFLFVGCSAAFIGDPVTGKR